ncbi:helix-turn-helix transcriptional regulator [Cupriavidus sp. AcVe19-6a]|uniref:helix-turn-helix transcriptional regulator n=1 Tax=Cupriavidus sp. AcVe19-6a TaxID=2821358 RepID=UPI001AEA47D7|nr:helix-turn-helix transcriptional regulator [Cupriavidus sp. AcVe19-6a]
MNSFSNLLLALYQSAREVSLDDFQEHALLLLKALLPFDAGRWGTGVRDSQGVVFHAPYLHNDAPESLEDYAPVRDQDKVAFYCMAHPGVTINCYLPEQSRHSKELQAYAHRYAHEQGLVTAFHSQVTGSVASVSLYRASARRAFTEEQRQLMQAVFPHLQEALKINQTLQAERLRDIGDNERWAVAVADMGGLLCFAEPRFLMAMDAEWPGTSTHAVPTTLFQRLLEAPQRSIIGRKIVVAPFFTKSLIFLKARKREELDNLTAREREIAELVATGLTHKEVAKLLRIAPSTVNNHLRAIHARVGARNNAELAAQLRLARP